jgi:hypothetical protein
MVGPVANKVLDKLHQATVGVLVLSTLYFGVEAFRATWYIQKHKAEQRVSKSASARMKLNSLITPHAAITAAMCLLSDKIKSARAAYASVTAADQLVCSIAHAIVCYITTVRHSPSVGSLLLQLHVGVCHKPPCAPAGPFIDCAPAAACCVRRRFTSSSRMPATPTSNSSWSGDASVFCIRVTQQIVLE